MRASTTPRRPHRRGLLAIALLIATRFALGVSSVAGAQVKVGPSIPAAGVGTAAARNSPNCGPDGTLAYPFPARPPCTRPLKKGESNGGATTMGVTAKTIKIVLVARQQRATGRDSDDLHPVRPIDRATGQARVHRSGVSRLGGGARAQLQHLGSHDRVRGGRPDRRTDEAAQQADALTVAEQKPFAVIAPFSGPVFAAELVAKKIIVFEGGVTNAEAGSAGAVPVGRRLRLQRLGSERGAVRGEATPGRDGEVVG